MWCDEKNYFFLKKKKAENKRTCFFSIVVGSRLLYAESFIHCLRQRVRQGGLWVWREADGKGSSDSQNMPSFLSGSASISSSEWGWWSSTWWAGEGQGLHPSRPALQCHLCPLLRLHHRKWGFWEGSLLLVLWSCWGRWFEASCPLAQWRFVVQLLYQCLFKSFLFIY